MTLFLMILCVFFCVVYVLIKVFYGVESNDLLHCVMDGMFMNDRLNTMLEIAVIGQGP